MNSPGIGALAIKLTYMLENKQPNWENLIFSPVRQGLIHFAVATLKDGAFAGAFIAGPVLLSYPDELLVDEIIQKFDLSLDLKGKITSYLNTIWVIGPQKLRHLSGVLFCFGISNRFG